MALLPDWSCKPGLRPRQDRPGTADRCRFLPVVDATVQLRRLGGGSGDGGLDPLYTPGLFLPFGDSVLLGKVESPRLKPRGAASRLAGSPWAPLPISAPRYDF